jgi:hypothetical protein
MFDKTTNKFTDKKGKKYDAVDVPLVSTFILKKPDINETKLLDKDEQEVVEFALKQNGRRLVHCELKHAKNDYKHDFDRGTVEHTHKARNYSFHKVIIPDGTTILETNFCQKEPHTPAIEGKYLTFINCNLVNVATDPTWTMQGSNNCQIKRIKKSEEDAVDDKGAKVEGRKKIVISHQVENPKVRGEFKEVCEDIDGVELGDQYDLLHLRLNK